MNKGFVNFSVACLVICIFVCSATPHRITNHLSNWFMVWEVDWYIQEKVPCVGQEFDNLLSNVNISSLFISEQLSPVCVWYNNTFLEGERERDTQIEWHVSINDRRNFPVKAWWVIFQPHKIFYSLKNHQKGLVNYFCRPFLLTI